ncbi:MAG TPA: MFS transporter [Dongiaceae bacterium]|jgi:MFS family permease|nr:MFS transporter [Dongiaceae bacterium]
MLQTLGNVSSLLLGTLILVVGNSLLGIVLPVRMGVEHVPEFLSGLVMSAFYLGFVLGSARIQLLIRRAGHIRAFAALAAILTACAMLHSLIFEVWVWMGLRVLSGFCMAGLYAIIESWLNVRSTNENRGQVLAIYVVTVYTASFGGQFLVNIGSVEGGELFAIVGLAVALSLVPVVLTRVAGPEIDKIKAMSLMALYRASPLGVVVTCGAGLISGAFYALGAIYANEVGLSVFDVSLFMGAPIFGGLALQYPIGRLSDRYDRRSVLLGVIGGTMISSVALMLIAMKAGPFWGTLAAVFVFGGCLAAIYPIAVSQVYDYIERAAMVAASGGLLLIWSVGAMTGPLIASGLMGRFGPDAFFIYLAAVSLLLLAFTRYRMVRRLARPAQQQTGFVATTTTSAIAGALDPRTDPLPEFYYEDVDPGDR